jgi:hexulose-6-phosphate isomerase
MKVGITALVTPRDWTFEETLENIKAAGYESFEIAVRDDGPITLETAQADLRAMAQRAADVGITLESSCPAGLQKDAKDLMTDDATARAKAIDTWKRCIDLNQAMGIDTMLVVLGALPPELYYHHAYANALQSMQQLAPHAEQAGVNLAIEYVWNKFLLSPMECARFCAEVGSPRVGFYFDPGNMAIFGWPHHWVRICGHVLKMVHMKDFTWSDQRYRWPALLEGDVDYAPIMRELRAIGYGRSLISEVGLDVAPLEQTAEAIRTIIAM